MESNEVSLSGYLESTCDPESELLSKINRETHLRETQPHMLSGHYQGRVLAMLSKLVAPRKVLEIGTFTGYATLCLAEGLRPEGEIHTIDINDEREETVRAYFEEAGFGARIHIHIGDAIDIMPSLPGTFDLVFIDADKKRNAQYLDMAIERTVPGALILIDNVLWKGRIFQEEPDKTARQFLELNERVAGDQRLEKLILPIRDGLFVIRKK